MALPSALQRKRQQIEATTPALDDNGVPILVTPQSPPILTVVPTVPVLEAPAEDLGVNQPQYVPSLEPELPEGPASENLMEMFNEFEAELNGETAPAPVAPAAHVPAAPTPTPTPAPVAQQYQDPRLEAMIQSQQALQAQLAQMQAMLTQRNAPTAPTPTSTPQVASFGMLPQAQPTPAAYKFEGVNTADVESLLTVEERQTYGSSLPIITRVANRAAEAAAAQMQTRLEAQEQLTANLTNQFQTTQRNSYEHALHAAVPDIDVLMTNPEFEKFMTKPVPYSPGETLKERLGAAHRTGNVKLVAQIFNEFRTLAAASVGSQPSLASLQTPPVVAAMQTPAQPQAMRKLAWSKRDEAFRSFRAGKITQTDLRRVQNMYAKAEAQGRIDYDA